MMYDFDHNLAMAYGDEFNPNEVYAYQLREFSEEIGVNYKLVAKVLLKQSSDILKKLEESVLESELLTEDERVFLNELSLLIEKRARDFKEVALEMPFVSF